ncbi:MAG: alpha-mannosidase [Anaerolineae bacterium]
MTKTAILVSETHWDRAWYAPFQVFRIRLVRLVDRLIEILDSDPTFHSFTLDGQMIPIEDYLEIRPERRADLQRLVEAGQLHVGPWYVLADEYLVSPEALIRNLLIGMEMAESLGGVSREGYVPDSFGHISQLPQILKGFGIDSALFWRGVGDEGERLGNEFWWDAPDGSRVLASHLRDGYHNAANLGYPVRGGDMSAVEFEMETALAQLREAIDVLAPHAQADVVLLLNGVDHVEADPHVPAVIAEANATFDDMEIVHGTLTDYVERVRAAVDDELPVFQGEFNRSRYAYALQGVYSSRMYLQQANARAQTLLERYVEPLNAWAWLLGERYPTPFLALAWRTLLKNHPHDDICGCSVDSVHRENEARFDEVQQIGATLARDGYRALMRHIDRTAQPGVPFVLFNPTARTRSETTVLNLQFEVDDETAEAFHLVTADGKGVPLQVLDRKVLLEMEVNSTKRHRQIRAAVQVDVPGCGYRVLYALPGPPDVSPAVETPVRALDRGMENARLRVEIQDDGTLDLLDKRSGRRFHGLGYLQDDEDAGDEYDYSPAPQSERITTVGREAEIRRLHLGPLQVTYEIRRTLALPVSLTPDRQRRSERLVRCPVVSTVTLRADSARVEVRTTVENRVRDHRLRVCFPSDLETDVACADGHFDVLTRPIDLPEAEGWTQPPSPTRHQRAFVDLSDGETGLAIFNRGLPEYEVLRDGGRNTVAVTLLRCVGWLSRDDLLTREDHAGPALPTPEAQCLGSHTFEYAIAPHAGDWRAIYYDALSYRAPLAVRRGTEQEGVVPTKDQLAMLPRPVRRTPVDLSGDLPDAHSLLTIEPTTPVLGAVKQSEDGERLIVRLFNPLDEPLDVMVRFAFPIQAAHKANLREEPEEALSIEHGDTLHLTLNAKQVQTLSLQPKGR